MALNLIYARARNGVIGNAGTLPWRLPEDMSHFRVETMGGVVIMGRKTYESLPAPLAGRINIVVSRNPALQVHGANVYRSGSVKDAIALAESLVAQKYANKIWVIGGAEIYKATLPLADTVVVTEIDADYKGDTYMPKLGLGWRAAIRLKAQSAAGINLEFVKYERRAPGVNRFFQAAGRYVFWLFLVQLVAWSPAILNAFDVVGLTTSTTLSMALSTAGAIWLIDLAKSGMGQLRSRFQPTNPKE